MIFYERTYEYPYTSIPQYKGTESADSIQRTGCFTNFYNWRQDGQAVHPVARSLWECPRGTLDIDPT